jgi:hypothetical protein
MEILFPIFITVFYLLLDALNACRAFDSRVDRTRMPANPITKGPGMLYVFARWLPSQKIRMDLPVVYYIPCDSHETAKKLAEIIHLFVSDKGKVIDLPSVSSLKKYVSDYYQLTNLDLSRFPIPTNRILEGMK